jgi:hypothetical protein
MLSNLSFKDLFGISFVRFIAIVLLTAAAFVGLGVYIGRTTAPPRPATSTSPAPPAPPVVTVQAHGIGCGKLPADVEKRNIVWRTLNGELLEDSPERSLALGLLPFTRTENGSLAIQDGMDRIVNRFTAYYSHEQRTQMFHTLRAGEPIDRVATIQRILVADRAATNLLECILRDDGRMQLALSGQPVPLE